MKNISSKVQNYLKSSLIKQKAHQLIKFSLFRNHSVKYDYCVTQQNVEINNQDNKVKDYQEAEEDQQILQINKLNDLFESLKQVEDIKTIPVIINSIRKIRNKQFRDFIINHDQRQSIQQCFQMFIDQQSNDNFSVNDLSQMIQFIEDLNQTNIIQKHLNKVKQIFIQKINSIEKLSQEDQVSITNIMEIINYQTNKSDDSIYHDFYDFFIKAMQQQELQGQVIARIFFIYKLNPQKFDLKDFENELIIKVDEIRAQNFHHFIKLYYLIPAVNYKNLQLFNLIEQELIEIMEKFHVDGFKQLMNWMKYSDNLSSQFCQKFEKIILNKLHRFKTNEELNQVLNFIQLKCFDYNSDGIYKIVQIVTESNIHLISNIQEDSNDLDYMLKTNEENKRIFINLNKAKFLETQNERIRNEARLPKRNQVFLDSSIYQDDQIQFADTFEYLSKEIQETQKMSQIDKYLQILLQFGINNKQTKEILQQLYYRFMKFMVNFNSKQNFRSMINVIYNLMNLNYFFKFEQLLSFNKIIKNNIEEHVLTRQFPQMMIKVYEFGKIQQIQGMSDPNLDKYLAIVKEQMMNHQSKLKISQIIRILDIATMSPYFLDQEIFNRFNDNLSKNMFRREVIDNADYIKKSYYQTIKRYELFTEESQQLEKIQKKIYHQGQLVFEDQSQKYNNRIFNSQFIMSSLIQEYLKETSLNERFKIESNKIVEVFHSDIQLTNQNNGRKIVVKIQQNTDSYANIQENENRIADHLFMANLHWLEYLNYDLISINGSEVKELLRIDHPEVKKHFRSKLEQLI